MHRYRASRVALLLAGVAATVLVLAGCAAKTGTSAPDAADEAAVAVTDITAEEGVRVVVDEVFEETVASDIVLKYRMSVDQPVSYTFTSTSTQTMHIQERSIPIESNETLSFSVHPKGLSDGVHTLGITIDGLSVKAVSPQGELAADGEELVGKGFDMTLTQLGEEGGLPDPDVLMYAIGGEGTKSVVPGFGVMFPDLPDGPVTVGSTWPARVEVTEQSGDGSVVIAIDAVNTLEGLDTIDGFECARITSVLTGTITGTGTEQGVAWTMDSVMDGSGTWYFAYEDGILVSDWTEGTADGSITVDAPDGAMTIPVTREFNMVTELVR